MTRTLRPILVLAALLLVPNVRAEEEGAAVRDWAAPPFWTPRAEAARAAGRRAENVAAPPLPFFSVAPCRVADTRGFGFTGAYGPPFMPGSLGRDFTIAGQCGIPVTAQAVSFNFTVTNTAGTGFLLVYPQGTPAPTVSTLNYVASQTVANAAVVSLGATGAITAAPGLSGFDLIIDVNGYYAPTGIVDTVNGLGGNIFLAQGADVSIGTAGSTLTISALSSTANAPNSLVKRDGSGGFSAGTITGSLNGNATSATTALSAASFTGPLAGDVVGPQGGTLVTKLQGLPIAPVPTPAPGQVLTFNGASWAPASPAAGAPAVWAQVGSQLGQLLPVPGVVIFQTIDASGMSCSVAPAGCTVFTAGRYTIDFSVQNVTNDGFEILVNGAPYPNSRFASGSDVVRGRVIATLAAGDFIQLNASGLGLTLIATTTPGAQTVSMQIVQIGP